LADSRRGKNTQLLLANLLRQAIYTTGYEDVNGAERLSQDPPFRLIDSEEIRERGAALTPRLHHETDLLTPKENLAGLAAINRELIAKAEAIDSPQRVCLGIIAGGPKRKFWHFITVRRNTIPGWISPASNMRLSAREASTVIRRITWRTIAVCESVSWLSGLR
jgi:hypothetical protein